MDCERQTLRDALDWVVICALSSEVSARVRLSDVRAYFQKPFEFVRCNLPIHAFPFSPRVYSSEKRSNVVDWYLLEELATPICWVHTAFRTSSAVVQALLVLLRLVKLAKPPRGTVFKQAITRRDVVQVCSRLENV